MKFDVLIVLGGPSEYGILNSRLDKCLELFNKKDSSNIIVTGHSESKIMKDYLEKNDVPAKSIFTENHSTDTFGNAFFSKLLFILPKKWKALTIVTSEYHVKRAKFIFKKIFGKNYKLKFFSAKTNVDPITWEELIVRENLAFAADELLLNNLHLILMKEQK